MNLQNSFNADMTVYLEDNVIHVTRPTDEKEHRSIHGTTRSLIANMVEGVSKGYEKTLELVGVGYRAANYKATSLY